MLKKRAARVLLPLLFSFCFVFSGFLSVDVFAYDAEYHLYPLIRDTYYGTEETTIQEKRYKCSISASNLYTYSFNSTSGSTYDNVMFGNVENNFYYPYFPDEYDYYAIGSLSYNFPNANYISSAPDRISQITVYEYLTASPITHIYRYGTNLDVEASDNLNTISFNFVFEFDQYLDFSIVDFEFNTDLVVTNRTDSSYAYQLSVLAVPKDTSAAGVNSIISAISNQTTKLNDSIGQAADDVQQSIEDQYSGDPETEFSVDDVITQHNEKMGVLSFGSDVMLQFLDMFQSANVGTAELTLPGFNITVENVEYSVWPDYSFNFEQLNEWVPALMSVIRVMLPAFVWLMVLRYCINVFEKNFLSNGG